MCNDPLATLTILMLPVDQRSEDPSADGKKADGARYCRISDSKASSIHMMFRFKLFLSASR